MDTERILSEYGKRLDGQDKRLDDQDKRLDLHDEQIRHLDLVIHGNDRLKVRGVLTTMEEMSQALRELVEWRDQTVMHAKSLLLGAKIMLGLLALIAGGIWIPQIPELMKFLTLLGG